MASESELLRGFLEATDAALEEQQLSALLLDYASPVIRKTVRRRLITSSEQDREDVTGEVTLELVARLKRLKSSGDAVIERFAGYVAVAANNGCDQYLRHRFPQRHRLKNRLRYLLSKPPNLSLWEDVERGWVCGRTDWKNRTPVPLSPDLAARAGSRDRPPEQVLSWLLTQVGGPVEFDTLTGFLAAFWGIKDCTTPLESVDYALASAQPGADSLLAQKQSLQQVWCEIENLPASQRAALLLNLREVNGGSALWLLPAAGIVTVRRIAELAGIPADEFAELWRTLPLPDLAIAQRLGLERQQVINLRQAARQRLGRRLRLAPK